MSHHESRLDRRRFLKNTAAGIGAAATGNVLAKNTQESQSTQPAQQHQVKPEDLIWRNKQPGMEYQRMGRTNFMVSRVVAGVGANNALYRRMLQRGINYIDTARGYGQHELKLADLLKRYRDKLFITSKSTNVAGYAKIDDQVKKLYRKAMQDFIGGGEGNLFELHKHSLEKQEKTGEKPDLRPVGKRIANMYIRMLDESLQRMNIDTVDCYMMHGIEIPWIFDCLELWEAHEKAHKAGKVKHFGFSTHKHIKQVLAAGIEAGKKGPWKIDLIMPSINPTSFDEPQINLKAELAELKKQDVGIIAMKTSGVGAADWEAKKESLPKIDNLNPVARKKLWMLNFTNGLIDAVVVAIKNNQILEESLKLATMKLTAAEQRHLKALVKKEMAGLCHLCGHCETICPEQIAVTDMVRYYAYIHQYNEKQMARDLYTQAGYNPADLCSQCGKCASACPANIPVTDILYRLSHEMA
jgi:predicted aldo/keto reductase-like oxidoreductase